jgi:hypothetical protein
MEPGVTPGIRELYLNTKEQGEIQLQVDGKGRVLNSDHEGFVGKGLDEVIGKQMADKILEEPSWDSDLRRKKLNALDQEIDKYKQFSEEFKTGKFTQYGDFIQKGKLSDLSPALQKEYETYKSIQSEFPRGDDVIQIPMGREFFMDHVFDKIRDLQKQSDQVYDGIVKYEGKDLDLSDPALPNFYDKEVVKVATKLAKKLGVGKPEKVKVAEHSFDEVTSETTPSNGAWMMKLPTKQALGEQTLYMPTLGNEAPKGPSSPPEVVQSNSMARRIKYKGIPAQEISNRIAQVSTELLEYGSDSNPQVESTRGSLYQAKRNGIIRELNELNEVEAGMLNQGKRFMPALPKGKYYDVNGKQKTIPREVIEQARKQGYNTTPVYHGSSQTFNKFDLEDARAGMSYFSENRAFSERFGEEIHPYFLKDKPILDIHSNPKHRAKVIEGYNYYHAHADHTANSLPRRIVAKFRKPGEESQKTLYDIGFDMLADKPKKLTREIINDIDANPDAMGLQDHNSNLSKRISHAKKIGNKNPFNWLEGMDTHEWEMIDWNNKYFDKAMKWDPKKMDPDFKITGKYEIARFADADGKSITRATTNPKNIKRIESDVPLKDRFTDSDDIRFMPSLHPEAMPVVQATDKKTGKPKFAQRKNAEGNPIKGKYDPVYETIDYDLVNSPLVQKHNKKANNKKVPWDKLSVSSLRNASTAKEIENKQLIQDIYNTDLVDIASKKLADEYTNVWSKDLSVQAGTGWYSRMRGKLSKFLGKKDHELFAQLLGATSARTPVEENFAQAFEAMTLFKQGKYDEKIKLYKQAYNALKKGNLIQLALKKGVIPKKGFVLKDGSISKGKDKPYKALTAWIEHYDLVPKKSDGGNFNINSGQVMRVLTSSWLDLTTSPKTPNFAGNLTGRTLEATIDVWAGRYLRRMLYDGNKVWRIQPMSETGVSDVDFALGQLIFREAGKKLGMNPDDLQAIAWFGEKGVWEQNGWTSETGALKSSFDESFDVFFPKGRKPRNFQEGREIMSYKASQRLLAKAEDMRDNPGNYPDKTSKQIEKYLTAKTNEERKRKALPNVARFLNE